MSTKWTQDDILFENRKGKNEKKTQLKKNEIRNILRFNQDVVRVRHMLVFQAFKTDRIVMRFFFLSSNKKTGETAANRITVNWQSAEFLVQIIQKCQNQRICH